MPTGLAGGSGSPIGAGLLVPLRVPSYKMRLFLFLLLLQISTCYSQRDYCHPEDYPHPLYDHYHPDLGCICVFLPRLIQRY